MNRRTFAKAIAAILRKHKVKAGVIKSNGSTSPSGADKYEAYFALNAKGDDTSKPLFMSFNMDDGTMGRIDAALKSAHIAFIHEGGEGTCFKFFPYELPGLCCRCKKSYDTGMFIDRIKDKPVCDGCAKH